METEEHSVGVIVEQNNRNCRDGRMQQCLDIQSRRE